MEWADVDMRRKEFTLRRTKNGETRVVPMTPAVYEVFVELRKERRLDTHRVFLYNDHAIAVGADLVSARQTSVSGRSSVVES